MNSQINLTAAKLRKTFLILALGICSLLTVGTGYAQTVTGTLTQNGTGLSTFNITQNQSFQLVLNINTNYTSTGITYFFQVSPNGTTGVGQSYFQLVARDMSMSPYADPTTSNANAVGGAAGLLDPVNDRDLGGTTDFPNPGASGPGPYTIGILTFNTLNAPVGQYQIFLDPRGVVTNYVGDANGQGTYTDVSFTGPVLATINVIPEPATVGLAVIGGSMLLILAWRKQRAARA